MKERNPKNRKRSLHTPSAPPVTEEEARAFFVQKLGESYGEAEVQAALSGSGARKTSFRVNSLKAQREEVLSALSSAGYAVTPAPFYGEAFSLEGGGEKDLLQHPLVTQGKIYLQSLSSMLPPLFLDAKAGEDVLDMTAAPGGKTTEIAALTGNAVNLTACERDGVRAERLKFNLNRQGARATVLQEDARNLSDYLKFDRILLDAPCSGSGTLDFSRPETYRSFSSRLLSACKKMQRDLLFKAANLLKRGGRLVYSTCSVFPEENDAVAEELLKSGRFVLEPISAPWLSALPLLPSREGTVCVCPDGVYEGFYCAVFRFL